MAKRQRQKYKPLQCDAYARTGTKESNAETGLAKMAVNAKRPTSIKFYVKLQQHLSTKILYSYLNI